LPGVWGCPPKGTTYLGGRVGRYTPHMESKRERPAVHGVVERLAQQLKQHLKVQSLILFGSRAEGRADEWSDYDVIVVSPDFEGVPLLERGRMLLPYREPRVAYDFLCYTPAEFDQLSSQITLVAKAAREGVRII